MFWFKIPGSVSTHTHTLDVDPTSLPHPEVGLVTRNVNCQHFTLDWTACVLVLIIYRCVSWASEEVQFSGSVLTSGLGPPCLSSDSWKLGAGSQHQSGSFCLVPLFLFLFLFLFPFVSTHSGFSSRRTVHQHWPELSQNSRLRQKQSDVSDRLFIIEWFLCFCCCLSKMLIYWTVCIIDQFILAVVWMHPVCWNLQTTNKKSKKIDFIMNIDPTVISRSVSGCSSSDGHQVLLWWNSVEVNRKHQLHHLHHNLV